MIEWIGNVLIVLLFAAAWIFLIMVLRAYVKGGKI